MQLPKIILVTACDSLFSSSDFYSHFSSSRKAQQEYYSVNVERTCKYPKNNLKDFSSKERFLALLDLLDQLFLLYTPSICRLFGYWSPVRSSWFFLCCVDLSIVSFNLDYIGVYYWYGVYLMFSLLLFCRL